MNEKKTILLTGVSGFLGAHIAERLSGACSITALIRNTTNLWRLDEDLRHRIQFINTDDPGWQEAVVKSKPHVFIHSAWTGVAAGQRDAYAAQAGNITFSTMLMELAYQAGVKKIIGLGSQAEYGYYETPVTEDAPCRPFSAYGACKLSVRYIMEAFCGAHNIQWYWLRLFPLYGTGEDVNWFLPMVITHALNGRSLDLTACGQQYAYLHTDDFAKAVEKVVHHSRNAQGVYNLGSMETNSLRHYIDLILQQTGTEAGFKFGALPYRPFQVMNMTGDAGKFYREFDFTPQEHFENRIGGIIDYYRLRQN